MGRVIKDLCASAEKLHTQQPLGLGEMLPSSVIPVLTAPKGQLLTELGCDGVVQTSLKAPLCDLPFPSWSKCRSHKGLRQRV